MSRAEAKAEPMDDDDVSSVGDSVDDAAAASMSHSVSGNDHNQGKKTAQRKLKGDDLSIGHIGLEDQQVIVTSIKEGAFYREKQRDAWIAGMAVAFTLFVGLAIGGFFLYKSKINSIIDIIAGSKLSDDDKEKLKTEVDSFDGIQMLWYLGWALVSFLIGYTIYFFMVRNWRRRQVEMSTAQAMDEPSLLASKGRLLSTVTRSAGNPMVRGNYTDSGSPILTGYK